MAKVIDLRAYREMHLATFAVILTAQALRPRADAPRDEVRRPQNP
jgi:hypothetical protein